MKILLSPAKSMNDARSYPKEMGTDIIFAKEAIRINKLLQKKSVRSLSKLMHISDDLAVLNFERNQSFDYPFTESNARPAVFYFDGDVYQGLDVSSLDPDIYPALQEKVRILSGLYGLLRPLDLIQAYRLEMGTKMAIGVNKNLPAFWRPKVTHALNEALHEGEYIVNLASAEYFAAVDVKKLKGKLIQPQFKDFKDGKLKMISFFAKKARGMMARHLVSSAAEKLEAILQFNAAGYQYSEAHTTDPSKPVFIR